MGTPRQGLVLPSAVVGGEDAPRLVEYAVEAERAGWDGVFMWDVLVNPPPPDENAPAGDRAPWHPETFEPLLDPFITLAGMATRTTTLTLGTWIVSPARRHPWQMARDLATLDRLSNGRVLLGVGLGRRPEYDLFGTPWEPRVLAERYDEALELLDLFWSGEPVHHRGEHFTVDGVALLPTPVQRPRIPIYVGGFWPARRPLERAARWDGYMPVVSSAEDPDRLVSEICAGYRSLAREDAGVFLCVDPDDISPERAARYGELGVSWLASWCLDESGGDEAVRSRIRRGPPV